MAGIDWQFTLALVINGIMIGLMYALIALGFVLIYKATDAINFAQGEFVMFAAFIAAGAGDLGRAAVLAVGAARGRRHGGSGLRHRAGGAAAADRPAGHRGDHGDDRPGRGAAAASPPWCSAPAPGRSTCRSATCRSCSGRSACRRCSWSAPGSAWFFSPASAGSSEEPGRGRDARGRRQPAGGDGDGDQRAALFRARLGDGRGRSRPWAASSGGRCSASTTSWRWSASRCFRW